MSPLRVLLLAEACNPEWVSVPLVGWSQCAALRQLVEGHIVTQIRNRESLLRAGLVEGRDFTAIDSEKLAGPMWRLGSLLRSTGGKGWTTRMALGAVAYPFFERLVWKSFGPAIKARKYDIVHRITPLSPTLPSLLAKRCARAGVPFVLGPLNGGVPWPPGFEAARRQEREWLSYVRGIYRLLPGYRATRRHARAILLGSRDTWNQMPSRYHGKCFYLPENGIDPERFSLRRTRQAGRPLKALFVGRLVPYKGADMLIEAAAEFIRRGELTLDIIGDGPQRPLLQEMAQRESLLAGLNFRGWVAHAQIQQWLADSDILTFPSVREFGGGVALEAMAVGTVPVVMDYGGTGELVTEATGFLLKMGPRSQIVAQLRRLLAELCAHPDLIESKSPAAVRRAREQFTWATKAQRTLEVYHWAVNPKTPAPRFPMPIPDP